MNFEQFMSEIFKIAIEHIKKFGPVTFVILVICWYFYNKSEAAEAEGKEAMKVLKTELKEFRGALEICNDQRERLAVKVSAMEVQISSYIQTQSVRKSR